MLTQTLVYLPPGFGNVLVWLTVYLFGYRLHFFLFSSINLHKVNLNSVIVFWEHALRAFNGAPGVVARLCLLAAQANSVLFGVYYSHNSLLIVLPAIPRELVYIRLSFLSGLRLAARGPQRLGF